MVVRSVANPAHQHLYNSRRWRKIRLQQLEQEPFCAMCLQDGKHTPGKIADHITPHKGDEQQFWTGRLQTLCKTHHDSTKQREEHIGLMVGGKEDGTPIDPNHHWNNGK